MSSCNAMATSPNVAHLLALETEAETISMSLWLKGNNFPNNYWIDGVIQYTAATYITKAQNLTYWEWMGVKAIYWNYLKYSAVRNNDGYAVILYWNTTNVHEYQSKAQNTINNYICEASGNL